MIRKIGFVVLAAALIVSACGRQITPNPTTVGPTGGFMTATFQVNGTLNFSTYSYVIVFNSNGNPSNAPGSTPEANATQTNYQNYSFAVVVTQSGGGPSASVYQFVPLNNTPSLAPSFQLVPVVPGQITLNANSNGLQSQFSVTFLRSLAAYYATGATPTPSSGATATPTPSPTPTATATGSASPTPTASASSAPGLGSTWFFNYFVIQGNVGVNGQSVTQQTILDSLGSGGATDTSWVSPALPVTTAFNTGTFYAMTPVNPISDPAAQIYSGTIVNTP